MKTIIVHHRSLHHAKSSGYARLIDFLPEAKIVTGNASFPYKLARLLTNGMRQDMGRYDSLSLLKELELYKLLRKNPLESTSIHYLNAERDIRHLIKWKQKFKEASFFGTFHKPSSVLKDHIRSTTHLKRLDGAITVGINQVDFLKEWLKLENVSYIPHGIDTAYFHPSTIEKKGNRILFVGQYLRDFETFNKSIKVISERFPLLQIDVVLSAIYGKFIEPQKSIKINSNIDDGALRKLYQEATLLFLPLLDATVCNSILEALACGLPIVTSDVGGISEYLKGSENIVIPQYDSDGYIDVISNLLKDESRLKSMEISSRQKAMDYDWKIIAAKIKDFYLGLQK